MQDRVGGTSEKRKSEGWIEVPGRCWGMQSKAGIRSQERQPSHMATRNERIIQLQEKLGKSLS